MRKHRLGVALAVMCTTGCVGYASTGPLEHDRRQVELDRAGLTRVRLRMSAGELEVRGGSTRLLDGEFAYNVPHWKPSVRHTSHGAESELEVVQGDGPTAIGNTENTWQLSLNDERPIDLDARLGAGEARLSLGSLHLANVELHVGAGEANVDLRGHPVESYRVRIYGGVGSATVRVPKDVGVSAAASGGLGSITVRGLERRGSRWINERAASSPVTIGLDVRGGIGEIQIVAE